MRIGISLLIILIFVVIAYSDPKVWVWDREVTLSTHTATVIAPARINRRYFLGVNINSSYDCLMSTYAMKVGDVIGMIMPHNYGFWEENYYVYNSTWFAIALSSGVAGEVKLKIREKE